MSVRIIEDIEDNLLDEGIMDGLYTPLELRKIIGNVKKLKDQISELSNLEIGDWFYVNNIDPMFKDISVIYSKLANEYDHFARQLR